LPVVSRGPFTLRRATDKDTGGGFI
jgi:hypothetical protein